MNLSLTQKIIAAVIAIGVILIAIFQMGLGGMGFPVVEQSQESRVRSQEIPESADPQVVSTNPAPLKEKKEVTILPTQVLEFSFNRPLENVPETKITLEPTHDFKVELSEDRKTVKVIPVKPFELGQGYTIFIKSDTKFDGGKNLGSDTDFHFTTISYKGV